jgi:hypothetical protein
MYLLSSIRSGYWFPATGYCRAFRRIDKRLSGLDPQPLHEGARNQAARWKPDGLRLSQAGFPGNFGVRARPDAAMMRAARRELPSFFRLE